MCEEMKDVFLYDTWLVNNENTLIDDVAMSYVKCDPELVLLDFGRVVVRRNHMNLDKVKIMSGTSSGHEPAFVGYVGKGFLTAAVLGEVFSSPSISSIFSTIKELSRRNIYGTLIIVSVNQNDRLNFTIAVEKSNSFKSAQVKIIYVQDSIRGALSKQGSVGTLLVQKIAGAMSELGFFLDEIYDFCTSILDDISTTSVAIQHTTSPWGKICSSANYLEKNVIEFGVGCRGESGYLKLAMKSTKKVVEVMLEQLDIKNIQNENMEKIPVVMVINNFGCTSKFEERIFVQEVLTQMQLSNYKIVKLYVGHFMTSLRMAGLSITVMKLTNKNVIEYLNHPTSIGIWQEFVPTEPEIELVLSTSFKKQELKPKVKKGPLLNTKQTQILKTTIIFACEALISCERQLNMIDAKQDNGNTGTNYRITGNLIIDKINQSHNLSYPCELFQELGTVLEDCNAGSIGTIHSLMLQRAANVLGSKPETHCIDGETCVEMLKAILQVLREIMRDPGTLRNTLCFCTFNFENGLREGESDLNAFERGVLAAEGVLSVKQESMQDSGAYGLSLWLRAVLQALKFSLGDKTTDEVDDVIENNE